MAVSRKFSQKNLTNSIANGHPCYIIILFKKVLKIEIQMWGKFNIANFTPFCSDFEVGTWRSEG